MTNDFKCDDCGDELPASQTYISAYDGQRRCKAVIRCTHEQSIRTPNRTPTGMHPMDNPVDPVNARYID